MYLTDSVPSCGRGQAIFLTVAWPHADQALTDSEKDPFKKQETFYERLEFLGDAFLDMLVVEHLYDMGEKYINDEGTLSFLKQSAVSNKTLGFIALRLNLH